jgi:regulator of protease activity HflC (stomatin/prohibitin superfamily)
MICSLTAKEKYQILLSEAKFKAYQILREAEIYAREKAKKGSSAYSMNFVFISDRFNLSYYL